VGREAKHAEIALALGAAGTMFAVAPLGTYEYPLALGAAGLGLLAPAVFDQETGSLGRFTRIAVVFCAIAVLVAIFGYIGVDRGPGDFPVNIEGLFYEPEDLGFGS